MYVPAAFAENDVPKLLSFMEQFSFATVVTQRDGELIASHVPVLIDRGRGPYGTLRAHLATHNEQVRHLKAGGEALVIFQGPHTYISPSWYENKENVPTWNYTAVHAYGIAQLTDRASLLATLTDLVDVHENGFAQPWQFRPEGSAIQHLLTQIVAFEVPITRLQGKFKLNQNRTAADRAGVIEVLSGSESAEQRAIAELMEKL